MGEIMNESQSIWPERVHRYCEGLPLAVGNAHEYCDQCESVEEEESHFSWSACDSCGSRLGGDRLAAHAVDKESNVYHYDICPDCAMFHANGELPDNPEND